MEKFSVDIQNVSKRYHKGKIKALDHCTVQIPAGYFSVLTGKSGSGKTTLLNCICGLETPDEGSICLNGQDIAKMNETQRCQLRQKKIGIVFQFFHLLPEYTVWENILLPLQISRQTPDWAYIQQLLEILDLKTLRDRFPEELSGGEQQRAAIARALAHKPALLLADEPTGNLDRGTSREIVSLLRQCQTTLGQTLLVVTHDPDIARKADKTFYMEDGTILTGIKEET